MSKLKESVEQ